MNMRIFYIFLIVLYCSIVSAQETQPYGSLSNSQSVRDEFGIALKNGFQNAYSFSNRYKGVKGHPFLYNEWKSGIVCLKVDSVILNNPNIKFKFDSYNNELWILNNTKSLIAYSTDINWFALDGELYQHSFYKFPEIDPSNRDKFYELLYDGEKSILVREVKKVLTKANYIDKGMYSTGDPDDRFDEKNNYQLSFQKKDFQKIKLNLKSILKQLPKPIQSNLKEYCKTHNISGNLSEITAIQILSYLDTILE
ncbi:MAG: hypothetical protein IPM42_04775 [Saprospiraceae bacterium]|nr:hypothetical protein [Saprospiraceae bacterium]